LFYISSFIFITSSIDIPAPLAIVSKSTPRSKKLFTFLIFSSFLPSSIPSALPSALPSAYFTELITIIFLQIWLQFGASGKAFQGVTPSFHLSVK